MESLMTLPAHRVLCSPRLSRQAECSVRSSVLEQRVQDLQASMDEQATQRRVSK